MTAAPLSSGSALAWVQSLSIDLRAAAVLDRGGALLAGDAALGARAAAALAAAPDAAAEFADGDLLVVRSGAHAVAAQLGPLALPRLARWDLHAAAQALEGA